MTESDGTMGPGDQALLTKYRDHLLMEAGLRLSVDRLPRRRGRLRSRGSIDERATELSQEADAHAMAASEIEAKLRDRWSRRGVDEEVVAKELQKAGYEARVLALYTGPAAFQLDNATALKKQKALSEKLTDFWVAGGHDLEELDAFLSAVDEEVVTYIPV